MPRTLATFRWFLSLWLAVSLVACTAPRTTTTTTVIPVNDPARYQAVQDAIHPGDNVHVVTHAKRVHDFQVTRVDAGTLYGTRDRQAFEVPFADISSIEIQRRVTHAPSSGGSSGSHSTNLHGLGKGGGAEIIVLLVAVVMLVAGYWTVKYVYTNVEKAADARTPAPSAAPEELFQPAPAPTPAPAP